MFVVFSQVKITSILKFQLTADSFEICVNKELDRDENHIINNLTSKDTINMYNE